VNRNGNGNGIDGLIALNVEHSRLFCSPGMALARRRYRAEHPTEIGVLKCMDGRLNLPLITNTALGIIQPWRNIAGRFDLGWIAFQQSMLEWTSYAIRRGRSCLVLVTYHYSNSSDHRGCAGFKYDTQAAKAFAAKLTDDFREVFGSTVVYPIQIGVETDLDALILHGEKGEVVNLSEFFDTSEDGVARLLSRLYPSMPPQIRRDFAPLVIGNIGHVADIRMQQRPLTDAEHQEHVIAVGRGFDWLHEANKAIIVGPFDPDMRTAIVTAGKIVADNVQSGRVRADEDLVLMTAAPYRELAGPEPWLAQKKAIFLRDFALQALGEEVPDLVPKLQHFAARVNMGTRLMEVLSRSA